MESLAAGDSTEFKMESAGNPEGHEAQGNRIDREVRNQWETELIARFVINGKQN
jgi:hypothetical protein